MIELSDEAGVSSASYSYDAYGNQIKRTSGEDNAYRFSTKEYSSLTGLIYFGARYYDPEIGRFLTKDPLGFAGGINQYIYCESDPVNWIDPWGLCKGEKGKSLWEKVNPSKTIGIVGSVVSELGADSLGPISSVVGAILEPSGPGEYYGTIIGGTLVGGGLAIGGASVAGVPSAIIGGVSGGVIGGAVGGYIGSQFDSPYDGYAY